MVTTSIETPPPKAQHFLDAIAECQKSGLVTRYFFDYQLHPEGKVVWQGWLQPEFIQVQFSKSVDSPKYLVVYDAPHLPTGSNDFIWFDNHFASEAEAEFFIDYIDYKESVRRAKEKAERDRKQAKEEAKRLRAAEAEHRRRLEQARPKYVGLSPSQIVPQGAFCLLTDRPFIKTKLSKYTKARNQLVLKYLPIIEYYAKYYYRKSDKPCVRIEKEDLRQDYIFTLVKCINKHKCKDGKKLDKYIRYTLFQKNKGFNSRHTDTHSLLIDNINYVEDPLKYIADLDWRICVNTTFDNFLGDGITQRERDCIALHYGLHGGEPTSFAQIADCFNLSQSRVRKIHEKGLRKLKHCEKLQELNNNKGIYN